MRARTHVETAPRPAAVALRCRLGAVFLLAGLVAGSNGCMALPWKKDQAPAAAADSLVLTGGALKQDRGVADPVLQAKLDTARRAFQNEKYDEAEKAYADIVKDKKIPVNIAEEALFRKAEAQHAVNNLRDAAGTYRLQLKNYPSGQYSNQAARKLFDIALYWLKDTREEMEAADEGKKGWGIRPASWFNFSKDKPFFEVERNALNCLEEIRLADMGGPLGEKATFYLATVNYFRKDYRMADLYYSQLYENYPNSNLAPKAVKQAIICKQINSGGTCYDCRDVEETRKLLDVASRAYPELVAKDEEWLQRQLVSINLQQADRDWNIAEFYRRTGHPGPAYFYYELVRRRYPNTKYAEKSVEQMTRLRGQVREAEIQDAQAAADRPGILNSLGNLMPRRLPTGTQPEQPQPPGNLPILQTTPAAP